uniref:Uncharacterized protein n=1 Tax=Ditylenchus dipsaci TaxID=166011 RepID=A0A915EUU1_9BILA
MTKLFEDNQQDLEMATEQLSGFLENELVDDSDLNELKQKVQDKARYVESRRNILIKMTDEGTDKNQWEFNTEVFIGTIVK